MADAVCFLTRLLQDLKSKVMELESQQRRSTTLTASRGLTSQSPDGSRSADNNTNNTNNTTTQFEDSVYDDRDLVEQDEPATWNGLTPRDGQVLDETRSQDEPGTPDYSGVVNPLVRDQAAYISISGRLRYLGHSSTWSFTQQVLELAHQSPLTKRVPRGEMYVEGDAYRLPFEELYHFTESDMSGLPSLDVSLYYVQSVKFRTNPLFYLFDEHEFTTSVHEFYKSPLLYARAKPIWFIHYLVIMALGKALVSRSQPTAASQNVTSAGSHLLTRALRLLPDITHLAEEPIDATEILCAIALYLQSIDHRCAAHIYVSRTLGLDSPGIELTGRQIGQALRMAQSYGLHKVMQPGVGSEQLIQRCRRLWWTVYMLDRRFSSSYGVPAALHDEDITVPVPTAGQGADEGAIARKLYVKICQLQGRVISSMHPST